MEKDYWTKIRGARDKLKETLDKTDRDSFTKKFVQRLRMGRDMEAPYSEAIDDYGDYSKFENDKNKV